MREDDMLRLSLKCARRVVRGEDYAQLLAEGMHKILAADAGVGLTSAPLAMTEAASITVVTAGAPPLTLDQIAEAVCRIDQHPTLSRPGWPREGAHRVSDHVILPAFWDTEAWLYFHGFTDGKYAAALPLVTGPEVVVWIGVHRSRRDFDSTDMEVLESVTGPLGPALAFRAAWDEATAKLQSVAGPDDPLTTREAQVLALVEKGWTNQRIGHALALSERTVRKHLENINAKLEVTNRTAAVARWRALTLC